MQDAPQESDPAVVLPEFKSCPHCKSSAFRRLDEDNGMSPRSDSSFLFALATWLVLILRAPVIIIWLWQPTKETITAGQIEILRVLLSLDNAGVWILDHGFLWLWVAALALHGFGSVFAGCPSCRRGFFLDHAFKQDSVLSRAILTITAVANLRRKPWLGIPAALTIKAMFILIIVFTISNAPMLLIMGGAKVLCFCGCLWFGLSYYGNSEEVLIGAIATSFGLYLLTPMPLSYNYCTFRLYG